MQQQYLSFGAVACLAKRWLYAQMIDPCLWPDICTELIIASIYMKQEPTIQPQTGFLRFLEYVANVDWSKEMILLNFNDDLSDETVEELERQFTIKRSQFPPLCLVTSCDGNRFGIFAKHDPTVEILNHVGMLARKTVEILENNFFSFQKYFQDIFTPSLSGYDLVIHLDSSIVPPIHVFDVADFNKRNEISLVTSTEKEPAAGFHPVKFYLEELREGYKSFAIFFHDPCGGDKIAVLWRPDAAEDKDFTVIIRLGKREKIFLTFHFTL
jgi:U3 small nucleolar RNA-associated protein 22